MESKRPRLLQEEDKQKRIARVALSAPSMLRKNQLGFLRFTNYCRLARELRVSCMQGKKVQIYSCDPSSLIGVRFNSILANTNTDQVFTVNQVEAGGFRYGIITIEGLRTPELDVYSHKILYVPNRKVNSSCWASLNHLDSHLLLCFVGFGDTPSCAVLLPASLFLGSYPENCQPGVLCTFQIPDAWSCAWSMSVHAYHCFSTGLSQQVLLTNVATGHQQSFGTNSDVLAQQFATMTPLLFNGCRSGELFGIDLRCGNQGRGWKAICLSHDSAVTSLQILQDGHCLVASDMTGTIKLWDMRATKCVTQYEGHVNKSAYLPLHVNEEEGVVAAVGQDCYTRIWSLRHGHLLTTIPSPYPASENDIPSVAFSSRLGGFRGAPGLLMAVREDLYCFSYS
ncbi:DDB1- and CUL4-associated factor 4-like protein 2 [Aotus nancymaae]|uniref:DDB1- and CUL4-associated factor 4-like protein 2 n=1 Tax=Aotus nancymaae TaxID=37293 RepID=UPI0030FEECE7